MDPITMLLVMTLPSIVPGRRVVSYTIRVQQKPMNQIRITELVLQSVERWTSN